MHVAAMGRIERSAEQPDAQMPPRGKDRREVQAGAVVAGATGSGRDVGRETRQGRIWPLPRTRYL
jgi:hypothetical protein